MFAWAPPRGGHRGATSHTPKFAAPPPARLSNVGNNSNKHGHKREEDTIYLLI